MPSLLLQEAPNINLDTIQTNVINKFVKYPESRCIAFHKVGTGKTRLAYGWLLFLRAQRRSGRCLIVIRPKAIYDWRSEADRIGFDRTGINFVSFANLKSIKLTIPYDTIIIDELFLFGSTKSYRSKRLGYLCGKATNVLGLSGTILSKKDNTPIWGYCVVVGIFSCIARNLTDFRSRYQTGFKLELKQQSNCILFKPKPNWEANLFPKLDKRISFYFPKDYVRTIHREVAVASTKEQSRLINKLVKLYVLETKDGEIYCTRATEVYHRVRQLLNGWIQLTSGKLQIVECEKRAALLHKVCELHESSEQCIIWCAYRNDVKILRSMLEIESLPLVGGMAFDIHRWQSGNAKVVVATMGSGQSINFLNSIKVGLFFSLSPKRLDWQQSCGRMGRRGADTTSNNLFIRYSVDKSLDQKIFRSIQETENAEEFLIAEFQRDYNIKLPL